MAFTQKEYKNRAVSKRRSSNIQLRNAVPVIKKVDIEAIKEEFAAAGSKKKATKKAPAKKAAPKAEESKEATAE